MKLIYRPANAEDLSVLVKMLANDALGSEREDSSLPINQSYSEAFEAINKDPNNELIVAQTDSQIVGMMQLTFIPYLTHKGSWRCLIEGVRVSEQFRGQGLGTVFFNWAINYAKKKGSSLIQLTSDKQRPEAIRFYEKLGFKASHEGFKLALK